MKTSSKSRQGYWPNIFLVGLSVLAFFPSGWMTSEQVPPQALPHEKVSVQGAVYYVAPGGHNSNPGTAAQPWRTIQKAANTLAAGDTVYIRAGTYEEQVIPQNSGSAGQYITYAAYPGETAIIDGNNITLPAYETGLFVVEDTNYIRVSGLRIVNAGPNDNNAGIYVDNAHHVIVENNYTYNTASSGIGVWGSSNVILDGNEVRLACNDGEQEVITVAGTDTFEVRNNLIHDGGPGTNGGEGICIKDGATNGLVYDNHVYGITNGQRTCLYVDAWDKETYNIDVYQNTLHDCSAGISLASENGGLLHDVNIYNNIVYHTLSNGLEIGNWGVPGVPVRPIRNVTFINNTVYDNGSDGWGGGFFNENPDVQNVVVRNNIFSQNLLWQMANESAANLTVDHNLIYGSQAYAYAINGTDDVQGNPLFANASGANFRLQSNSPAIDSGSPIGAPNRDFEGTSRPQDGNADYIAAYDIGAYEYMVIVYTDFVYLPVAFKHYAH